MTVLTNLIFNLWFSPNVANDLRIANLRHNYHNLIMQANFDERVSKLPLFSKYDVNEQISTF